MSEHSQGDMDLDSLIENQEWERAHNVLANNPNEAKRIVNPSLGWTKLHWLCSIGSAPQNLIQLAASLYPEAVCLPDHRYGDTPLHIVCRNSQTSSAKLKILLDCITDPEGVLIRNRFGGTALHSASNHNAVIEAIQALVEANPRILRVTTHEGMHAISALWTAYIQTIPGYMCVARTLKGESVTDNYFSRFWKKMEFLATSYFLQSPNAPKRPVESTHRYVLHGLLQCHVLINNYKLALLKDPSLAQTSDANGNLPLHILVETRPFRLKEREALAVTINAFPKAASILNDAGDAPLFLAIRNKIPFENGLDELLNAGKAVIQQRDRETRLFPFQLAAVVGGKVALDSIYRLLTTQPDLLGTHRNSMI